MGHPGRCVCVPQPAGWGPKDPPTPKVGHQAARMQGSARGRCRHSLVACTCKAGSQLLQGAMGCVRTLTGAKVGLGTRSGGRQWARRAILLKLPGGSRWGVHLGIRWGWERSLHGGCHSGGRLYCGMLDRAHKVASRLSQELPSTSLLPLRGQKLSTERLRGHAGSGLRSGYHCASGGVGQLLQPLRGLLPDPVQHCSQELACPGLLPFSSNELSAECLRGRTGNSLCSGHHGPGGGVHQLLQPLRVQHLSPVNPRHLHMH